MTAASAIWTHRVFPILCRRYGIERPMPDMTNLAGLYEGWEPQERRQALDTIQDTSKQFGRSIEKNLEMGKTAQPRPGASSDPIKSSGGGGVSLRGYEPRAPLSRPHDCWRNRARVGQCAHWPSL